ADFDRLGRRQGIDGASVAGVDHHLLGVDAAVGGHPVEEIHQPAPGRDNPRLDGGAAEQFVAAVAKPLEEALVHVEEGPVAGAVDRDRGRPEFEDAAEAVFAFAQGTFGGGPPAHIADGDGQAQGPPGVVVDMEGGDTDLDRLAVATGQDGVEVGLVFGGAEEGGAVPVVAENLGGGTADRFGGAAPEELGSSRVPVANGPISVQGNDRIG